MKEELEKAWEEIKRVDHLIYVSLKYTRTVDVIKSVVERLIASIDHALESLLLYAKEKKMIKDIPKLPYQKADLVKKTFTER